MYSLVSNFADITWRAPHMEDLWHSDT